MFFVSNPGSCFLGTFLIALAKSHNICKKGAWVNNELGLTQNELLLDIDPVKLQKCQQIRELGPKKRFWQSLNIQHRQ